MARRRLSHWSPYAMSAGDQEEYLRLLADNPTLMAAVERLTGKPLRDLSIQQRVAAVHDYQSMAMGNAVIAQAARVEQDIYALAQEKANELALTDQLALAQSRIETLQEENARLQVDLRNTRQPKTARAPK